MCVHSCTQTGGQLGKLLVLKGTTPFALLSYLIFKYFLEASPCQHIDLPRTFFDCFIQFQNTDLAQCTLLLMDI